MCNAVTAPPPGSLIVGAQLIRSFSSPSPDPEHRISIACHVWHNSVHINRNMVRDANALDACVFAFELLCMGAGAPSKFNNKFQFFSHKGVQTWKCKRSTSPFLPIRSSFWLVCSFFLNDGTLICLCLCLRVSSPFSTSPARIRSNAKRRQRQVEFVASGHSMGNCRMHNRRASPIDSHTCRPIHIGFIK